MEAGELNCLVEESWVIVDVKRILVSQKPANADVWINSVLSTAMEEMGIIIKWGNIACGKKLKYWEFPIEGIKDSGFVVFLFVGNSEA